MALRFSTTDPDRLRRSQGGLAVENRLIQFRQLGVCFFELLPPMLLDQLALLVRPRIRPQLPLVIGNLRKVIGQKAARRPAAMVQVFLTQSPLYRPWLGECSRRNHHRELWRRAPHRGWERRSLLSSIRDR